MRPEDRPFTFASRLHDTAARWLQPAPMPEEMQVLNTVMLEQFVEGLPIGMADWVRCHWPASLEAKCWPRTTWWHDGNTHEDSHGS